MKDIADTPETQLVNETLTALGTTLAAGDAAGVAALFETQGYWRDLIAMTWNIKTMEGRDAITDMVAHQAAQVQPGAFHIAHGETATEADGITEAWIGFETATGVGEGHIRLRNGKIWTLLTALQGLKDHPEPVGTARAPGVIHGNGPHKTWAEARSEEAAALGHSVQPEVVIIGGGQGGIALAARLRALDVATIVIEKNPRAGDSWRNRYKSLCLHDPVWYDHLPYLPFPENWPVFTPKDKLGDWLEMYVRIMELTYWSSTTAQKAEYDAATGRWTVRVVRDGQEIVLKPRQLVLATGMSGKANVPVFKGQDIFQGEQQHSSQHPGPDNYRGKKVVVIGSNNSAHDICAALYEGGADVTMVQRSTTHIVRSEPLMTYGLGPLYSEAAQAAGITTHKADMTFASIPYAVLPSVQKPIYDRIRAEDAAFYKGLEKAGFRLDYGADDSGLFMKYLRRGSGYYIDVGASQLIIDGKIKLKAGQLDHLSETSVVLDDGTELAADLVIYATGYGSMNGWAADLISQDVADKVGKCWGLGSGTTKDPGPWEGELRNMWKPTQQEALWFHGGNLHQSRHYSAILALQLKARLAGIPTPVYGLEKVHHVA